ncbi:lipopolysaccharide biosynthesis protein [Maribacter sp. 2210JD10-5]|uniref:lipopolysaccharide biosynthesis protein n=1 Tax=Maribacter sp. 2210JD10-5 TaxID=3386272 RepID=UPI0039BC7FEE
MSRVEKALKNAKVSVLFYLLATFTAFFTRKIFLNYLGDDFMGLTGTLKSILGFLNLAELGIGTAIGFTLYKPLFDNNENEIKRLVNLIGYLYKRLGFIIIGAGIIVSLFFPLIFENQSIDKKIIYIGFYSYLISAGFGFFINYSQVVLQSDQKGYVITSIFQSFNISRQIVQALIAFYLKDFVLWLIMELVFSLLNSYYINKKVKKTYPFLNGKVNLSTSIRNEYPTVIKKIKQVFVHRISSFVTSGTDQILIYALVNLKSVAFFGNYSMIFTQVSTLINTIFSGIGSGIGNLVAENDAKKINDVFWEMMGIRFFLTGVFVINLFFLINPLITVWLGSEYILSDLFVYLMLFNLAMQIIRLPIDNYVTAYGLYQDTWAPIAQMSINLGVSIFFGIKMGISGIMLGTSISMFLIIFLWKPYFLFKKGFNQKASIKFWPKFLVMLLSFTLSFIATYIIVNKFIEIKYLTLFEIGWSAIKINLVLLPFLSLIFYSLNEGFRKFSSRILIMLRKYAP